MLNVAALAGYVALLLLIGWRSSRKVSGQADFTLAGRSLGLVVLVGTLLATWTGTGSIFGQAEKGVRDGLPALVLPFGPIVGFVCLALLCGRVRRHGAFTLQDILEERFGPAARVLGTLTLVTAYLIIVSYQLRAGAVLLVRVGEEAGWIAGAGAGAGVGAGAGGAAAGGLAAADGAVFAHDAILVGLAVVLALYTASAGLLSIARTDLMNGVLMTTGLTAALVIAWAAAGGAGGVLAALPEAGRSFRMPGPFTLLSLTLPTLLLVLGDANLHTRLIAARSTRTARSAMALLVPAVLLIDGAILLLAFSGHALLPAETLAAGRPVVLELALLAMPAWLGALLVATIFGIIVSTADSYLLSASSALLRDVYQRFVAPRASEARLLAGGRLLVLLVAAAALGLAFAGEGFFEVAFLAYTIYGVGITPVLLAALFWRRATPAGAVASMLGGALTVLLWESLGLAARAASALDLPAGATIEAVVPAALAATLLLAGVSLVTQSRAPAPRSDSG